MGLEVLLRVVVLTQLPSFRQIKIALDFFFCVTFPFKPLLFSKYNPIWSNITKIPLVKRMARRASLQEGTTILTPQALFEGCDENIMNIESFQRHKSFYQASSQPPHPLQTVTFLICAKPRISKPNLKSSAQKVVHVDCRRRAKQSTRQIE